MTVLLVCFNREIAMPAFKIPLLKLFVVIFSCWTMGAFAFARDDRGHGKQCPTNLNDLLRDKTVFGVSSWGEKWVEYHTKDGVVFLSDMEVSKIKTGTWDNPACLVICYSYPDGNGWCPQWREVEGGWVNIRPGSGEVVHQIYAIENGDIMGLGNSMHEKGINILDAR